MYRYRTDIIGALSARGFTTTRIRKEKIISEATLQRIRRQESVSLDTLNTICVMLHCQLSDIVEIVPTDEEKIKYY